MLEINLLPAEKKKASSDKKLRVLLSTILFGLATAGLAGTVLLGIYTKFVQPNHIDNLKSETETALNEIRETPQVDRLLTVQNQLQALPALHGDKPTTSRLFGYLTKIVPDNVALTQMEVEMPKAAAISSEGDPLGDTDEGLAEGSVEDLASGVPVVVDEEPTSSGQITFNGVTDDLFALNVFIDVLKNAEYTATYYSELDSDENSNTVTEAKKAFNTVLNPSRSIDDGGEVTFQVVMSYDPEIFNFDANEIAFEVPNIKTTVSETERPDLFKEAPKTEEDGGSDG